MDQRFRRIQQTENGNEIRWHLTRGWSWRQNFEAGGAGTQLKCIVSGNFSHSAAIQIPKDLPNGHDERFNSLIAVFRCVDEVD